MAGQKKGTLSEKKGAKGNMPRRATQKRGMYISYIALSVPTINIHSFQLFIIDFHFKYVTFAPKPSIAAFNRPNFVHFLRIFPSPFPEILSNA